MGRLLAHYRLKLNDVLESHRGALAQSGGLNGVRDYGLIESAIARPFSGHHRWMRFKAAALTESLVKNHGFIDGNKRTALLALSLFLDRSGYELFSPDGALSGAALSQEELKNLLVFEAEYLVLGVAENRISFADLVIWFGAHLRRR